jgi:hypothetical protein
LLTAWLAIQSFLCSEHGRTGHGWLVFFRVGACIRTGVLVFFCNYGAIMGNMDGWMGWDGVCDLLWWLVGAKFGGLLASLRVGDKREREMR